MNKICIYCERVRLQIIRRNPHADKKWGGKKGVLWGTPFLTETARLLLLPSRLFVLLPVLEIELLMLITHIDLLTLKVELFYCC